MCESTRKHTFLPIDDEKPINKRDRKAQNTYSKKKRKYLKHDPRVKIEISRSPYEENRKKNGQEEARIFRKYRIYRDHHAHQKEKYAPEERISRACVSTPSIIVPLTGDMC